MASLFDAQKRLAYIQAMENQLSSSTMLLDQFTTAVLAVASNWAAYAGTSPDAQELADTRAAFEAKAESLKDVIAQTVSAHFSLSTHEVVIAPQGGLPRTSSGKPQRRKTKQMYLDGTLPRARAVHASTEDANANA